VINEAALEALYYQVFRRQREARTTTAERRERLEHWLVVQRVSPAVRERVMRLNPFPREGELPRGWHPKNTGRRINIDACGKGEFIRLYGREAFARVPRTALFKDGRRVFVSATALAEARP
jgi:hypothetical protein